jgi:hypothetical protein
LLLGWSLGVAVGWSDDVGAGLDTVVGQGVCGVGSGREGADDASPVGLADAVTVALGAGVGDDDPPPVEGVDGASEGVGVAAGSEQSVVPDPCCPPPDA